MAAPGNYARHNYTNGDSFPVLQSVKWTVKVVGGESQRLVKETMFGVILFVMLLFGIGLARHLRPVMRSYGLASVLALGTGFVTIFPVVFGYGGMDVPNRCMFILDVALVLSLSNMAVFAGCCLDYWAGLHTDKKVWAILFLVLFCVFLFSPESLGDSALLQTASAKHRGIYSGYYAECVSVYDYLENCDEEDVVIRMPDFIENFVCFYFDTDETGWVNKALAAYYHKRSVRRADG